MMFIISTDDGIYEYAPIVQNALAQVLMHITPDATRIAITQTDLEPQDIIHDDETGVIKIIGKDPETDFKHRTMVYSINGNQGKAIKQLLFLAESAMYLRDHLLTDMLSTILKDGTNDLDFDAHPDGSGLDG